MDQSVFATYGECDEILKVLSGTTRIVGKGAVVLHMDDGSTVTLHNVKHAPGADRNLFSYTAVFSRGVGFRIREDAGFDAHFLGDEEGQWMPFASLSGDGHQLVSKAP
ncbi:hypothetical protein TRVA0_054S00100 [Trichomonascus vanleenenianus]|uniref:uncharacterized protein n=1 Tax=Trichomonascus vanleenenianus TaxID=2268995 RepID=UPI003ECA2061